MKKAIVLFFLTLLSVRYYASYSIANSPMDSVRGIPSTFELMQQVMQVSGSGSSIILKEKNVLNLEAVISHRKKYIYFNPKYVTQLAAISKSKWTVITLLAHEFAHHQLHHTAGKKGSRPTVELEADEYAGMIL